MTKKVNWGIIGLGKIAHKFAHDIALSEAAHLQAVASRSLEKAEKFKIDYHADSAYGSYQELLKDEAVDIVYIALPHSQHFELSMLALQHDKSVLCEKPLGINPQEVENLQAEARKRKLFLMEGIWTRFIPASQKLFSLLAEKTIGEIISLKADFGFKPNYIPSSRLFDPALGGGSLLDVGFYPLYLSLMALGEPEEIKAFARYSDSGVDSHCQMLLQFPNGALAQLESSFEVQTPTEAHIYGTKGSIKVHSRFHHPEKISLSLNEGIAKDFEIKYRGNGYVHEIEAVSLNLLEGKIENELLSHYASLQLSQLLARVKNEINNKPLI
jgi:predicted dehydrogenase